MLILLSVSKANINLASTKMNDKESHASEEYPLPEVKVNKKKRFRIPVTIEPIVFGLFVTDSISESVIQNFVLMRTCDIHFRFNQSICSELSHPNSNMSSVEEKIQPHSAIILTGVTFLSKLFPAFLSLFVGPWSDYYGRKFILVLPCLGYCLQYALMIVFSLLPKLGPEYCLLAAVPVALTGGFVNFVTGTYSYISDISAEDNRSFRISMIESVMYCSLFTGLMSSSYLLKAGGSYGYALTYGICFCFLLVPTVFTYCLVPESVQIVDRNKGLSKIFDFRLVKEMFQVCLKKREGNKRAVIFLVIASLTLSIGVGSGEANVLYLYTKLQFGWDINEFTLWASVLLASSFFGLLVSSALFTKWLKISDSVLGIISYIFRVLAPVYVAFVPPSAPRLMFYNAFFVFFSGLYGPVGRAILSKSVPKEDLGKVFALIGATESIFPLATVPLFAFLYNSTITTTPNAFLFVIGSSFALCTVFFIIIYCIQKRHDGMELQRLHNEAINN